MSMIVAFTGPAVLHGMAVPRTALSHLAHKLGWVVRGKVDPSVNALFASREDTVKYAQAKKLATPVLPYDTFWEAVNAKGLPVEIDGFVLNSYTDIIPDSMVPDFTSMEYGDAL